MSKTKAYLIVQSILCILLVAVLSNAAIGIYRDGLVRTENNPLEWIYTREIVGSRFAGIAPLFFFSIGVGLTGIFLAIRDENQDTLVKDAEVTRDLIVSRVAEPDEAMKKEQAKQKRIRICGWIAFALCMIPILLYISRPEHFPNSDLEPVIAGLASVVLPFTALGIACLMVATKLEEKSILLETEAAQARMKEEKAAGIQAPAKTATNERSAQDILWVIFIVAAIVMIVAGILNGSAHDVLRKAINICTECVGLG